MTTLSFVHICLAVATMVLLRSINKWPFIPWWNNSELLLFHSKLQLLLFQLLTVCNSLLLKLLKWLRNKVKLRSGQIETPTTIHMWIQQCTEGDRCSSLGCKRSDALLAWDTKVYLYPNLTHSLVSVLLGLYSHVVIIWSYGQGLVTFRAQVCCVGFVPVGQKENWLRKVRI